MKKACAGMLFFLLMLCACASVSEEDKKNAAYHYQLGVSYLNDNNIQPAFVEFQKALKLNHKDKEIYHALGVIYLTKLEDYPKAIEHFEEALDLDESYSEASNNLGNAYAKMGRYHEAIKAYKTALLNPQYQNASMALNNLGMVYYRLSQFDEALDAFKEALKRYSNFYVPYYGLALCYNAKGQYGDASYALTRALSLDPLYRGNKEKAIEDLKERKLRARGIEEKDIADYLDIIKY
ncbi:MAG: tetratricopeptide repeat protein [Nitrospirota bacterium]